MATLGCRFDFLPAKHPVYQEGSRVPEEESRNNFDDPFNNFPIQQGEIPDHLSNYLKVGSITIIVDMHYRIPKKNYKDHGNCIANCKYYVYV